jgi:hypothetical protein
MSTLFLTGRQRGAVPQFLLPPGEENRGKGLHGERKIREGVFIGNKRKERSNEIDEKRRRKERWKSERSC